jgi:hypothetical protein
MRKSSISHRITFLLPLCAPADIPEYISALLLSPSFSVCLSVIHPRNFELHLWCRNLKLLLLLLSPLWKDTNIWLPSKKIVAKKWKRIQFSRVSLQNIRIILSLEILNSCVATEARCEIKSSKDYRLKSVVDIFYWAKFWYQIPSRWKWGKSFSYTF